MMVSIRRSSSGTHSTIRVTLYAAALAAFALTAISLLSNDTSSSTAMSIEEEEVSPQKVMMNTVRKKTAPSAASKSSIITDATTTTAITEDYERDEEGGDLMTITKGSITYKTTTTNQQQQLDYYHCGPHPTPLQPHQHPSSTSPSELILLHGAAFTKENWKTSGILDKLCDINNNEDGGDLSISAWDLPVSATGVELRDAFEGMVDNGVLCGGAVTFVTPSASGKALTTLSESVVAEEKRKEEDEQQHSELKVMVKGWISVASGAVLKTSDEALLTYVHDGVPLLAIHGDQDVMGKKVTERLVELTKAKGVELEGRHPVYLDSPDEFVMEVIKFMEENGL
ncbi:hypothetical protein QTG54_016328 [Skeletonema marinoi]|uniref:AB hydrolase-1 domain-containing protein n=1 Tax=Skeletonema marinoi TaxID=267567 RepID=A0AAD8XT22_9STRA|nr:hypothetical protein QTG54_016328 [Skeletonema marinoi]